MRTTTQCLDYISELELEIFQCLQHGLKQGLQEQMQSWRTAPGPAAQRAHPAGCPGALAAVGHAPVRCWRSAAGCLQGPQNSEAASGRPARLLLAVAPPPSLQVAGLMRLEPRKHRFCIDIQHAPSKLAGQLHVGQVSCLRWCAAACHAPSRRQRRRSSPRGRTRSHEDPQAIPPLNRPSCCWPAAQQRRRQEQGQKRWRTQVPLLPPVADGSRQADVLLWTQLHQVQRL
jgi:hypothetical protein